MDSATGTGDTPEINSMEIPFILAKNLGDLKEPGWILNGILPIGAKCSIYAAPGVGKSFLALDWCMSISAGMEWQGRPTTKGTTLYIAGEGMSGMPKRVEAWMAGGDCVDVPRVFFHPRPVNLMDMQSLGEFWENIDSYIHPTPVLIVIDTLATAMDGQDENDASLMTQAMNGVEMLIQATGATVVLIHHANKGGTYRGSSAYHGALDVMMELKKDDDDLVLVCKKSRDSMPFDRIALRLIPVEDSAVLVQASDDKRALTEAGISMLRSLSNLSQDGTTSLWLKVCHEDYGTSTSSYYLNRNRLLDRGYVMQTGKRWALTVKGQEELGIETSPTGLPSSPMGVDGGSDAPF